MVSPSSAANPSMSSRTPAINSLMGSWASRASRVACSAFCLACSICLLYFLIVGSPGCFFFQPPILFDGRQENHLQFQLSQGHFLLAALTLRQRAGPTPK